MLAGGVVLPKPSRTLLQPLLPLGVHVIFLAIYQGDHAADLGPLMIILGISNATGENFGIKILQGFQRVDKFLPGQILPRPFQALHDNPGTPHALQYKGAQFILGKIGCVDFGQVIEFREAVI